MRVISVIVNEFRTFCTPIFLFYLLANSTQHFYGTIHQITSWCFYRCYLTYSIYFCHFSKTLMCVVQCSAGFFCWVTSWFEFSSYTCRCELDFIIIIARYYVYYNYDHLLLYYLKCWVSLPCICNKIPGWDFFLLFLGTPLFSQTNLQQKRTLHLACAVFSHRVLFSLCSLSSLYPKQHF
jgi:hypothetical protein